MPPPAKSHHPDRLRRLARLVMGLCGCLPLLLGNLAVLQIGAWTGMVITRAPQLGLAVALEQTFGGQHPCRMCEVIQKAGNETRDDSSLPGSSLQKLGELLGQKFIAPLPALAFAIPENGQRIVLGIGERHGCAPRVTGGPPTPPPKALA